MRKYTNTKCEKILALNQTDIFYTKRDLVNVESKLHVKNIAR